MRLLVTGGCGFIGSHFVRDYLELHPDREVVNLDKLTYAGRQENLSDAAGNPNYTFVQGDICDPEAVEKAMKGCQRVVHFAAESHVDRSLEDARVFLRTNVEGTYALLEAARREGVEKFVHISTDEVYGHLLQGSFSEESLLNPRNPYSASKAGGDRLAYSYSQTHDLDVSIVRPSNNFGPNQFPEKLLPLFITNILRGKKVPVYGDGMNVRDWLYVRDNCAAIRLVLEKGKKGESYNVPGRNERPNMDVIRELLKLLGAGEDSIEYVEDRKGHDKRYSITGDKIQALGYAPTKPFSERLGETVQWYKDNASWWKPLVK